MSWRRPGSDDCPEPSAGGLSPVRIVIGRDRPRRRLAFPGGAALAYDFLGEGGATAIGPGGAGTARRPPRLARGSVLSTQATMTRRTRGREIALQVLYQIEQNPGLDPDEVRRFIDRRLRGDKRLVEFAEALIAGVQANQPRIDALIAEVAENWRLDRMAAIDRNILRLGAFEMLFCPDVPTKVAINEALELAKRYSTAQSSRFVNGILDRLQRRPTPSPPAAGRAARSRNPAAASRPPGRPRPERGRPHRVRPARGAAPGGGRPARPHDPLRRRLLALRGRQRGGLRRPGGAGDHRPRHGLGPGRRPARGGPAGGRADRRGRVDGRAATAARSTSSATSSATTTPPCSPPRPGSARRGSTGSRRWPTGSNRWASRSTLRPCGGPSPARPSAAATWPTGSTRTGQVAGPREAFARYLGDGGPAEVPKPRLDWTEAVALTVAAGGVAALAHPPYNLREATRSFWPTAASAPSRSPGPGSTPNLGRRWRAWADSLDLVPVSGSDFHAQDRPGRRVGASGHGPRRS